LLETKLALGAEKFKELYKAPLERSAQMWRDIVKDFDINDPYQESTAYVKVAGVTSEELNTATRETMQNGTAGLKANPEHMCYTLAARLNSNEQVGVETMGMYGGPTEMIVVFDPTLASPTQVRDGFHMMIGGTSKLTDGTMRRDIAVHQFKPCKDGFEVIMTVYFPKNTPKQLVDGHKIHLAIEVVEAVKAAYQTKLTADEAKRKMS